MRKHSRFSDLFDEYPSRTDAAIFLFFLLVISILPSASLGETKGVVYCFYMQSYCFFAFFPNFQDTFFAVY